MRPYEPPSAAGLPRASRHTGCVSLVACGLVALVGLGTSGVGAVLILNTTPFLGIPVDAQGNPLPVQGYPQLWIGLSLILLAAIIAAISVALTHRERRVAFLSKFDVPHDATDQSAT